MIFIEKFLIIVQVSRSISHGMGVLAEEQRTAVVLLTVCNQIGKFSVHVALHIVHGRGVSAAGEFLLSRVEKYYKEYVFHASRNTKILKATLGNDAGMYGAARLVLNE